MLPLTEAITVSLDGRQPNLKKALSRINLEEGDEERWFYRSKLLVRTEMGCGGMRRPNLRASLCPATNGRAINAQPLVDDALCGRATACIPCELPVAPVAKATLGPQAGIFCS